MVTLDPLNVLVPPTDTPRSALLFPVMVTAPVPVSEASTKRTPIPVAGLVLPPDTVTAPADVMVVLWMSMPPLFAVMLTPPEPPARVLESEVESLTLMLPDAALMVRFADPDVLKLMG